MRFPPYDALLRWESSNLLILPEAAVRAVTRSDNLVPTPALRPPIVESNSVKVAYEVCSALAARKRDVSRETSLESPMSAKRLAEKSPRGWEPVFRGALLPIPTAALVMTGPAAEESVFPPPRLSVRSPMTL